MSRADAKRLLVALLASALILAYVFFTSADFKVATLIYFSLLSITALVFLNQEFFGKHWYIGIALYVADFFVINIPEIQSQYLGAAVTVLIISYVFIVPKAMAVIA